MAHVGMTQTFGHTSMAQTVGPYELAFYSVTISFSTPVDFGTQLHATITSDVAPS
jgi:hypothetical protein